MSVLPSNFFGSSEINLGFKMSQARLPLQPRNLNTIGAASSADDTGKQAGKLGDSSENDKNLARIISSTSSSSSTLRKSSNSETERLHKSSSFKAIDSDQDVMIEEKRKRLNGDGYTIHKYLRGRLLGKGGFAKVYLCTALDTNKQYAVKVVPKANLVKTRARQKLQAEIKIHRTLKHDNVCEYKHFFEDRTNCYILLELCHNQSMNELIKRRKRLTEPEASFFLNQIAEAVEYMHDQYVIHRDLKLGNLFLDKNMNIKVGDLGLATRLDAPEEKRKTICGTPNYIAPEVIKGSKETRGHSFEVDIWSMGVILYTILVGKPPYESKDVKSTYQRIIANDYRFPCNVEISDTAKDLISSMLQSVPSDRPNLFEIRDHPFAKMQIPTKLPQSVLFNRPDWKIDEFGEMKDLVSISREKLGRGALSERDINSAQVNNDNSLKAEKRVVEGKKRSSTVCNSASGKQFEIFDENVETVSQTTKSLTSGEGLDEVVSKTSKMTITDRESPTSAIVNCQEDDAKVLDDMLQTLTDVLEVSQKNKFLYTKNNIVSPVTNCGPKIWVSRYCDYTSKYGLGFLLGDGSSGVYFNDATKAVLEAKGKTFQYIERRKIENDDGVVKRNGPVCEAYSLEAYPEKLEKKVTLLKHFRNYLTEQQKKSEEGNSNLDFEGGAYVNELPMIYLKKWVRTKHAILFRLSDQTVQIVFYDQTEVLLTPDNKYVTYVNKKRERSTFLLNHELVGKHTEMAKRLKYSREILNQLLNGQQRR
mmetsp:Transcript_1962/g.2740  ORF Transcript_1962/g.2740 Transcript_1962/m.2740 type:complete len:760 (+) Transcript_1962:146-2425(+)